MITDISSINEFNDIINKNQSEKLLIDFYASWCEPCKKLSTILSECSDKYTNFTYISVDTGEFEELADEFDILKLPTVIIYYKNNKYTITGFKPNDIIELLDTYN
jgi:thioredoxin-like negative regulator of GroEL